LGEDLKESMRLLLILPLLVVVAGCISTPSPGSAVEYELNWTEENTTTFYLNYTQVKAVYTVDGILDFGVREEKVQNLTIVSPEGEEEKNYTAGVIPLRGEKYLKISFKEPFTGFIAYTKPAEGGFQHFASRNETVLIVLPPGTTTGNRFLGTAMPRPDTRTIDNEGREVLTWQNLTKNRRITLRYYKKNAPRYLFYTVAILTTLTILASLYYYHQIKKLKKIREKIEKM